jgi:hypothetical protein
VRWVRGICGRGRVEFALEVPVAEPVDGEVAGQHRGEQRGGVRMDRVEGGSVAIGCRDGPAQGVESGAGLAGQWHPGQRLREHQKPWGIG